MKNELTLFLGAMFGVGGATTALRLISTNISKKVLKKLPQKALTRAFRYRSSKDKTITKSIRKDSKGIRS